jgi:hypothetical protein
VNREWRRGTAKGVESENTLRFRRGRFIREEEWDCCTYRGGQEELHPLHFPNVT